MSDIIRAVELLRAGRLVAFPTETVYGLGADAANADAVARIFAAKGRPATNPLIVHVADVTVAKHCAAQWPETASKLAAAFWPGPLTLVLPKVGAIVGSVTAGLGTVGLRVPDHPLAIEMLRAFDGPVAAPSANKSNHVSPTTAQHVRDELGDMVDLILDGGPCEVGIESTVLDLSSDTPTILRPGDVSAEDITAIVGPVLQKSQTVSHNIVATSPGQQAVHYAPKTPAFRFATEQRDALDLHEAALITIGASALTTRSVIQLSNNPAAYAQRFYAALRELDGMHLRAIYVEIPPDTTEWLAVRDRISRATRPLP